jgi:hypothetical protein
MSKHLIQLEIPHTAAQTTEYFELNATANTEFLQRLYDMFGSIQGGLINGAMNVKLNATYATINGTFTGLPTAAQTATIAGQTLTARASGAVANEFNIGADAAATATNMINAINASATLSPWVVARSGGSGIVTVRAIIPGTLGNAVTLANGLTNFSWAASATRLAGGAQGTNVNLLFGRTIETT